MNTTSSAILAEAKKHLQVAQRLKWPKEITTKLAVMVQTINEAQSTDDIYRIEAQVNSLKNSVSSTISNAAILKGIIKDVLKLLSAAIKTAEKAAA